MNWIKHQISNSIFDYKSEEPYKFWSTELFSSVDKSAFEELQDQKIILFNLYAGTRQRLTQTVELWGSIEEKSAVQVSMDISDLYLAFVYPRETLLLEISERLTIDSDEKRICDYFSSKNSKYRHIRNSLAHGNFIHRRENFEFFDREWKKVISRNQIRLDFLIISDIILNICQ